MNHSPQRKLQTVVTDGARASVEGVCAGIDDWLGTNHQVLVGIRRHLHMHPEPSGQERETTVYLAERLGEAGVEAVVLRDGLGLVADAVIGDPGPRSPRVALRADIDALKIQDSKSVEYRSCREGVMHACGHDVRRVGGGPAGRQQRPGAGVRDAPEIPVSAGRGDLPGSEVVDRAGGTRGGRRDRGVARGSRDICR